MQAFLSGMKYVPLDSLSSSRVRALKSTLSLRQRGFENMSDDIIVKAYTLKEPGFLGIPRCYDHEGVDFKLLRTKGKSAEFPTSPNLRGQQVPFVDGILSELRSQGQTVGWADTGAGKTVCGLDVAAKLGRRTLVLVHTSALRNQWIKRITRFLGLKRTQIGIIQANKNTSARKPITIATYQTVAKSRFKADDFKHFGTVLLDEVHRGAAPTFVLVFPKLPMRYRLGLSATPHRIDGLDNLLTWNFGPRDRWVRAKVKVLPVTVYVRASFRVQKNISNRGKLINYIASRKHRNEELIDMIHEALDHKRQVLVVSDRVQHLRVLRQRLINDGMKPRKVGLYIGGKNEAYLDRVASECTVIMATYGMMAEGVDIPRLDFGIDATPRGSAEQVVGRIRRAYDGKRRPIWVTWLDSGSHKCLRMYASRMRTYEAKKFKIVKDYRKINWDEGAEHESKRAA